MGTIGMSVIGIGGMGSHHASYIHAGEIPGLSLAAVCDTNPERVKWARESFGDSVRSFEDADALYEAGVSDAVLIATPHYDHPALATKAFERGLHVLIEKPAGVYTKSVREMNEAAASSGKVFGIMFQMRTVGAYRKLKDLVDSGDLGEVQRTSWIASDWFRSQFYYDSGSWRATWGGEGGGVLLNQCPHNLDVWQWICGLPKRVRAFCRFGRYHDIEVEDDVTAYVEYENGASGVFIASTGEAPGTDRFEIAGEGGRAILESGRIEFRRNRVPAGKFSRESRKPFAKPEAWNCEVPAPGGGGRHQDIAKDFAAAITDGRTLVAPGEEGIRSLELANAMLMSAWTDSWVDIPFDDDLFHEKIKEKIATSKYKKPAAGDTMDVDGTF